MGQFKQITKNQPAGPVKKPPPPPENLPAA
jgi:hypothetical protein